MTPSTPIPPPDKGPLAALLVAHPEQVAAVFAVLTVADPCDGQPHAQICADMQRYAPTMEMGIALVEMVTEAAFTAGLLARYKYRGWHEYHLATADRFAIAAHAGGVAGWLWERCGTRLRTQEERVAAMLARLIELSMHEERDGRAFTVDGTKLHELTKRGYRQLIGEVCQRRGLDVELEVARVWTAVGSGS